MDILYLTIVIILYYILTNNNIENFTLNFPENSLKCKCDLDNGNDSDNTNIKDNNNIEGFTNYDSSPISSSTKLKNRIYNIHDSPYTESASSYYEKKYYYPIKPLDNEFKFEGSNSDKYKNIGTNTDKLLNQYSNNNIESYKYIFGIKSEIKDNKN
jgi:hypothetical protein